MHYVYRGREYFISLVSYCWCQGGEEKKEKRNDPARGVVSFFFICIWNLRVRGNLRRVRNVLDSALE